MARQIVGRVSEFPAGERRIVQAAGRSIGVFNVHGTYYALRNSCPHQAAPLCLGAIKGMTLPSKPGEYHWARDGEILRCPWHGWEFDLRTGQSWFNPGRTRVRLYQVSVEPAGSGLAPGPYVAETYPVSIEAQYVVVEIGRE